MIQKYLKSFLAILLPFLILILLTSILYYFNILSTQVINYMKMIIPTLSMLIGGIYIGRHSKENGWLEGLKLGLIFLFTMFIFSFLAFNEGMHFKTLLYYFILLITSILGSMIGINNSKTT